MNTSSHYAPDYEGVVQQALQSVADTLPSTPSGWGLLGLAVISSCFVVAAVVIILDASCSPRVRSFSEEKKLKDIDTTVH